MSSKKPDKKFVQIYTDGAYSYATGLGGYGAVMMCKGVIKRFASSTAYTNTTNNRMELRAIFASLENCKPGFKMDIYTDSEYCVKMVQRTLKTNFGYNVNVSNFKNPDLLKLISSQVKRHRHGGSALTINWIRAHAGNIHNELADELAHKGMNREEVIKCMSDEKFLALKNSNNQKPKTYVTKKKTFRRR